MSKKIALIFLLIWPPVASLISFLLKANFFTSTLLFLGLPCLFLSFLNQKAVKKVLIVALCGIPTGIVIDYIMEKTGGWYMPYTLLPFKLFDLVTVDILVWFFFYLYFVTIFYLTFLKKQPSTKLFEPKFNYFLLINISIFILFLLLYRFNQSLLLINYFYFKFGLVLVILPIVLMTIRFPHLWTRFVIAAAYFSYLCLTYELTALTLSQWFFPGKNQFIGYVEILNLRFPLEELLIWIILGSPGLIALYEYFNDNRK